MEELTTKQIEIAIENRITAERITEADIAWAILEEYDLSASDCVIIAEEYYDKMQTKGR